MRQLTLIILLFISISGFAQRRVDSLANIPSISGIVAYDFPGGDMNKSFGNNTEIGAAFYYKTKKNWLFGIETSFLFGGNVKGDTVILEKLLTGNNNIIGVIDGHYADVRIFERGYKMPVVKIGKVIPIKIGKRSSVNSGLFITGGVGFIQHKIKYEVVTKDVPMLSGDYVKGFDRLTNGLLLSQNIGYMYYSKNQLINFFVSVEMNEGLTKNRRSFDYATKKVLDDNRLDLMLGLKFGWMFTIRKKMASGYYYD